MKVIYLPKFIMRWGGGLTLYKLVLIRKGEENNIPLHLHEACHVKQWTEIGFFKFPILYIIENIKYGYIGNKYEIEARQAAKGLL